MAPDAFWVLALPGTISQCLTKQLGQLEAPVGTLSDALGNLHLTSPAELDVAPDACPGEALVRGAGHVKCVCYGIGSFATCVTARTQLAFLLLFLEKCQVSSWTPLPLPPTPPPRPRALCSWCLGRGNSFFPCRSPGVTARSTTLCSASLKSLFFAPLA